MTKAVYIHIPFCNSICSYCDFPKIYYDKKWIDDYLNSLDLEIKKRYRGEEIDTIYIGGGTPSSLDINELTKLFDTLKQINFNFQEFTIECNLDSLSKEKIDLFKKVGINRVSIGIESFNKDNLVFLNRTIKNIELIDYLKKQGITNINVDLMYALPLENLEILEHDLDLILDLEVPHISTYSLIIEPNTMIYNQGITNIDENLDYEMYQLICLKLKHYHHYEISNFSLPGYESKHNLTYWNNEHYYGFGLQASGYIDHIRYTNTGSINKYIKGDYDYLKEELSIRKEQENEMILGLRKLEGVSKKIFYQKYQKNINEVFDIENLIKEGKLIEEDDYIKINPKYLYVSNEILINFIGEE